jgi:pyruvate formate lyase activating enzyme
MSMSLQTALDSFARERTLRKFPGGPCAAACAHRCLIREGRRGICQVRFNRGGVLFVPWGYAAGIQCDPIEKKPFFHLLPGSDALTFGMLGCDFHCPYCQNWVSSQALRDPASEAAGASVARTTPREIVEMALRFGAQVVASSYNEPLITSEWAVAIFREATQAGLKCAVISNGNATPEALQYLRPWLPPTRWISRA